MGAISIGVKKKPKGKISTHLWEEKRHSRHFVAINNEFSEVFTIEDFCNGYVDKNKARNELEMYKSYGMRFVIDTRSFAFGKNAQEAVKKLINN